MCVLQALKLTVPFNFSAAAAASSTVFIVTNANRLLLPEYLSYITYKHTPQTRLLYPHYSKAKHPQLDEAIKHNTFTFSALSMEIVTTQFVTRYHYNELEIATHPYILFSQEAMSSIRIRPLFPLKGLIRREGYPNLHIRDMIITKSISDFHT